MSNTRASGAIGPQGDAADGAETAPAVLRALEVVGASVQALLETVGTSARFGVQVARSAAEVRTWLAELPAQMRLLGVDSMPIGPSPK